MGENLYRWMDCINVERDRFYEDGLSVGLEEWFWLPFLELELGAEPFEDPEH